MRAAIVTVLALAVGLGIGYLLGASKGGPSQARAPSPALPAPAPEPPSALAHELPPPEERGSGTITGRVLRADGSALAGATVRAIPSSVRRDLLEDIRRLVADFEARHRGAVEVVTGSDGGYALAGLLDRPYDVAARMPGFRLAPESRRARPGAVVDFRAEEAVEVEFAVMLPDGTPAPDATVYLKRGSRFTPYAWSPEAPRLLLPLGSFACFAEHGDGSFRSEEMPLVVVAPAPATVSLRLLARSGLRGAVFFGKDVAFDSASVNAIAFAGANPPDPQRLVFDGLHDWTNAERGFRYHLPDLPPGRYLVGVGFNTTIVATKIVDVGEGIQTCDFVIDAIDPSLYVVVRVLDPEGKSLTDATFQIGYKTDDGSSSSSSRNDFPMRPDGSYLVLNKERSGQPGGTYWVAAESARYGKKSAEYKRGHEGEIVLRFGEAAALELTVEGLPGSEHADAVTVALLPPDTPADERLFAGGDGARPDAEGRVRLGPVDPGEYEVTIFADRGDSLPMPIGVRHVTLAAGTNSLTMPIPRLYTLAVRDPERRPGTLATLLGPCQTDIHGEPDDADRVVFTALPEGRYLLRRTEDMDGAMRITLPGPAEVVFRKQPYDAFRVIFDENETAWSAAGLKDGDLIVSVDGKELRSADDLKAADAALRVAEKATLGILRGGGRIDLRVNPKGLFEDVGGLEWTIR